LFGTDCTRSFSRTDEVNPRYWGIICSFSFAPFGVTSGLCLSKENEPKERTLLRGIFKLRLKPTEKLCVASLLFSELFQSMLRKREQCYALQWFEG
jgi:hypothetical protein